MLRFMMGLSCINFITNQRRAIAPSTLITTSCPNAPTVIANAPLIRLLADRKNTRPPYSPIRFGVKTAQVNPQKTDSTAFQVLITSTLLTRNFHFRASKYQFKNINITKLDNTIHTLFWFSERKSIMKLVRPRLSFRVLNIYQVANTKMATLIQMLRIFLVSFFKIFNLLQI